MGRLSGLSAYLSGPVESHPTPNTWRNKLTIELRKFGMKIHNPLVKPEWMVQISPEEQSRWKDDLKKLNANKETAKYNTNDIKHAVNTIEFGNHLTRKFCLALAQSADIMIVKVDKKTFTVGTWEEVCLAANLNKPTLFIGEDIPPSMWLVDMFNAYYSLDEVFHKDETALVEYLAGLDDGGMVSDKIRWMCLSY